jgi:hypothetical protein
MVIALGTAYIYLVTFFYELGYCAHFGIPQEFISPNLTTILVAAAAIGAFLFSSMQYLGFSVPLIRAATSPSESQKPYRTFFATNAALLVLGILLWRAYGFSLTGFVLFLTLALFVNFIFFGIGLIIHRKAGKSLRERFEALNKTNESDPFSMWGFLFEKFGYRDIVFVLVVIVTTGYAYLIGNGEAARQERFLVLKDSQDFVLLRSYGDLIIAANVDRTKKVTGNDILLLRTSSKDKFEFRTEKLGPLKKGVDIVAIGKQGNASSAPEELKKKPRPVERKGKAPATHPDH